MDYAALRARVARSNADTLMAAAFRRALGMPCRKAARPEGAPVPDRYGGWFSCFLNRERVRL